MNKYVRPKSRCSFASRLTICAPTLTSSAETGSSATMNLGLSARARAMAMRWRCPPLNSWG